MTDDKPDEQAILEFLKVIGQIASQAIPQIFGENGAGFSFHLFPQGSKISHRTTNMSDKDFIEAMDDVLDEMEAQLEAKTKSRKMLFQSNVEGNA